MLPSPAARGLLGAVLDLVTLVRTVKAVLRPTGAY